MFSFHAQHHSLSKDNCRVKYIRLALINIHFYLPLTLSWTRFCDRYTAFLYPKDISTNKTNKYCFILWLQLSLLYFCKKKSWTRFYFSSCTLIVIILQIIQMKQLLIREQQQLNIIFLPVFRKRICCSFGHIRKFPLVVEWYARLFAMSIITY